MARLGAARLRVLTVLALAVLALDEAATASLPYSRRTPMDAGALLRQQDYYEHRRNKVSSNPHWTWACIDGKCVRSEVGDTPPQSMATCSRLCHSTHLWPQPTGAVSLAEAAVTISAGIFELEVVRAPDSVRNVLSQAFTLFQHDLLTLEASGDGNPSTPAVRRVRVRVAINGSICDERLRLDTDESYKLTVRPVPNELVAEITAGSFHGARHGLETLLQLTWLDPYAGGGTLMLLKAASVVDAPKFPYRGLLLDTARNFFPISDILRTIDAMAASKLNTFHWHATDSQSFPMQLPSAPRLAARGAYDSGSVYTTEDIQAVVQHARARGVRVLIEIDAPGHVGKAWSWGPEEGFGELALCVEREPWQFFCGGPPCGQLNPRNEHVYDILEGIYRDVLKITGVDDIFHIGGDEVSENCWANHFNDTDLMELWREFTEKALERLKRANSGTTPGTVVLWSSRLTQLPHLRFLDPTTVAVQAWGDSHWPESKQIGQEGYRAIVSHVDAWYLDCGFGSWRDSQGGHCGEYRTWQRMYEHRPWAELGEAGGTQRAPIGGEACQWTEQVDPAVLDARVWPRAAAVAERLWSDPSASSGVMPDVYSRLQTQRSRLLSRGVRAAPLWPRWCTDNPGACNLNRNTAHHSVNASLFVCA